MQRQGRRWTESIHRRSFHGVWKITRPPVTYYAYLRVTDDDIRPSENANPVKTLRMRYDAWKKAGSKPFNTVATVALSDAKH